MELPLPDITGRGVGGDDWHASGLEHAGWWELMRAAGLKQDAAPPATVVAGHAGDLPL